MSERFTKLFSASAPLYASGAPVVIKAYALLLDAKTTNVVAQLKYQNVTANRIIALDVAIEAKNASGETLGAPVTHSYLNLAAAPGADFGAQSAITLPDKNTRSFVPAVTKVYFENGSIWEVSGAEWNALAPAAPIGARLASEAAIKEYRESVCKNATVAASCGEELWLCSCGTYNKNGATNCHACNASLEAMLGATTEGLEKDATYRRACALLARGKKEDLVESEKLFRSLVDWRDTEQKLEEIQQKRAEIKKKKRTKRFILFGAIGAVVLAILIAILVPVIRYRSACKQWEKGNYERAIEKIEKCSYSRRFDFFNKVVRIEGAVIDRIKDGDAHTADLILSHAPYVEEELRDIIELYCIETGYYPSYSDAAVNVTNVIGYLDSCYDTAFVQKMTRDCPTIAKVREFDGYWESFSGTKEYGGKLSLAESGYFTYHIDGGQVWDEYDDAYIDTGDCIALYQGSLYITSDTWVDYDDNPTESEYYCRITSLSSGYMTVYENSLGWTIKYAKD